MTETALDPIYCETKYLYHYGATQTYARENGDTEVCTKCGCAIVGTVSFTWNAEIVGTALSVNGSGEKQADPIALLAAIIGARMPFTVTCAAETDGIGSCRLIGTFAGGTEIALGVSVQRRGSWRLAQ